MDRITETVQQTFGLRMKSLPHEHRRPRVASFFLFILHLGARIKSGVPSLFLKIGKELEICYIGAHRPLVVQWIERKLAELVM